MEKRKNGKKKFLGSKIDEGKQGFRKVTANEFMRGATSQI